MQWATVSHLCCRPPLGHLCNDFTSTTTLTLLGFATVGTRDEMVLKHSKLKVSIIAFADNVTHRDMVRIFYLINEDIAYCFHCSKRLI